MPPPLKDSESSLINLINGTLEIGPDGTKLRGFDKSDFLTYQLPFSYDPEAEAPVFQNYLRTVLPYQELRDILAEYIGYVFIPNHKLKLEKTILLFGTGANGKSVFFDVINALLGRENVSTYSLQNLTDKPGYYRAMIATKLVNYASEINHKLDPTLFKQLVSGEPVEARLPYGQPFIMENYARLIFNTNELPKDVEHTNAYFRRFLIIPFDVIIPESIQDKTLANKIIAKELPGVLNWVLEGMKRLTKNKDFTFSEIVSNQIRTYKNESDTAWLFLEEIGYIPDTSNFKPLRELYSQYKSFCSENNYRAYSNRSFMKQLRSYHFETKRLNSGNVVFCKIDPSKYI
jgi:putative DNA primase/helicase